MFTNFQPESPLKPIKKSKFNKGFILKEPISATIDHNELKNDEHAALSPLNKSINKLPQIYFKGNSAM